MYDLPVLYIAADKDWKQALDAGANDFAAVPLEQNEVCARIKNLSFLKKAVVKAILQARQLEVDQQQLEWSERLRRLNEDLTSSLELHTVAWRLLSHFGQAVNCFASVLVDLSEDDMLVIAKRSMGDQAGEGDRASQEFPIGQIEELNQLKASTILPTMVHERLMHELNLAGCNGPCLGVPLVYRGQTIAAVVLFLREGEVAETQTLELLNTFANQGAIAFENAHLFSQVRQMAMTDSLTGLFNRRHFFLQAKKVLAHAVRYQRPLVLMRLDINGFEEFHDQMGQFTSERVLTSVAKAIGTQCRTTDLSARFGSEEFAVLMIETNLDEAHAVAVRLCRKVENQLLNISPLDDMGITIAIGLAGIQNRQVSLETLLAEATQALNEARSMDRSHVAKHRIN